MTYVNAVKYMMSLPTGDANIERAHKILDSLGSPHRQLRSLHICGKYGKNSCSRMISSILSKCSLTVGEYSPYRKNELRETISINGKLISHDCFAELVQKVSGAYVSISEDTPTFEEALVLCAILYFENMGCDLAIFEKGLRKNDAANVTDAPMVSVVASMAEASDEELSFHDIFRKGTRETVTCPQSKVIFNQIYESCVNIGSRLTVPIYGDLEIHRINLFKTFFSYRGGSYSIRSFSPCQTVNAITAIEAANALSRVGLQISDEQIALGLEAALLPHKCEAISVEPAIIVSDATDGVRLSTLWASVAQIKELICGKVCVAVDSTLEIPQEKVKNALASCNIELESFCNVSDDMTPARFSKTIRSLISPLLTEDGKNDALIIIGKTDFIINISTVIRKELGKI